MVTALDSTAGLKFRVIPLLLLLSTTTVVPMVQADSEVFEIKIDGREAQCSAGVWMAVPNQTAGEQKVCIGTTLLSGTTIESPAKTEMKIRNIDAKENVVTLAPFAKVRLATGARGESYTSFFGRILFSVKKRLSFFTVSDPSRKIQAAVPGTVFETEVVGSIIRYKKLEGAVNISQELKIEIGQVPTTGANDGSDTEKKRERDLFTHKFELLAGKKSEAVYPLDNYEKQAVRFDSFDAANQHFTEQLNSQDQKVDSETLANLNSTLGRIRLDEDRPEEAQELFVKALAINERLSPDGIDPFLVDNHMDIAFAHQALDQHEQAIKHFRIAYEIQMILDPWGPLIIELLLDLSDVYFKANSTAESQSHARQAIDALEDTTRQDLDDYNSSIAECDIETAQVIASSTADAYENMAYAWQNLGDEGAAGRYFERSENIINRASLGEYFDCGSASLLPSGLTGQEYIGDRVRVAIGYDSETDLTGEFFWNIHADLLSAYSFEGWKGADSSGGLKFNFHWLAVGHVRKSFIAADRNVFGDGKLTFGGGGELLDRFWSVYASKSTTGERFLGSEEYEQTRVETGKTVDSHTFIQTDTLTTTTKYFAHPYDWGMGFRAGMYFKDLLLRLRGGLDYETGDYSSSQMTASLGLEKRFPGSGHGLSLRAEVLHKKGDFETDQDDVRFSAYWTWSFGTVFRASHSVPEECIDFTLPSGGEDSCVKPNGKGSIAGVESAWMDPAWIRRAMRNPVAHKRLVDYYRYNRFEDQHDSVYEVFNEGPRAVDDTYTVEKNSRDNVLPVLENDSDPEDDELKIVMVSDPDHGTTMKISDSTVLYTPRAGFTGVDTFTYEIREMHLVTPHSGGHSTATVTVHVTNNPPVAVDDEYEVMKNSKNLLDVLVNDSDPDGDTLCIDSMTQPMYGKVKVISCSIEYAPDPGYCGKDSFTYTITDGVPSDNSTASVMITVVNKPPVAVDD